MQLLARIIRLPLRHAFRIAHGVTEEQENLLVELRDDGVSGYGEGASIPYYGVTAEMMLDALEDARGLITSERFDNPVELWDRLVPILGHNRFALAALDAAAHDLWGKKCGQPVYRLWGLNLDRIPLTDYTIGIDTVEKMVAEIKEYADWPILKIKLGTPDDLKIVRELRRYTSAVFRVDANCSWSEDKTIDNAKELKSLGVEFIEQPLPADDWEGMRQVHAKSALPVIADESCLVEEDVDRCAEYFDGINVKLSKCGGMTPARRMIRRARELGMKVMMGCMTESSVGISAIAQFLPLLDYADMDSTELIARDVAAGVRLEKGRVLFSEDNGNGLRLL